MLVLAGCGGVKTPPATRPEELARRTCVVLSVGSFRGLAHVGAIEAIEESGLGIDCVVGNSMGALVGSIYASAPGEPLAPRTKAFLAAYVAETERAAQSRALGGALILGLLTGGLGGALAGAGVGAATVDRVDHGRVVTVLRGFVNGVEIEELPLDYVTFYLKREGSGIALIDATQGDLATAVGHSIANPFIFEQLQMSRAPGIDPGADRVSATPVEDACRLFPDARLIAVNVTGTPVFHSAAMRCPLLEIRVDVGEVNEEAIARGGPQLDRVVTTGREATTAALHAAGWRPLRR
jgi:predicted acylesterase/phospholipase RssA